MRISSSLADHEELRVPLPPAADAVEMELRCDDGVFSILGMLIMRNEQDRDVEKSRNMTEEERGDWEEQTGGSDRVVN